MAETPTPTPAAPDPGTEAQEFLREHDGAYRDTQHPQHAKVKAEVRRRFEAAFPEPPKSDLSPELQAAADQPISPPPSLGPNDRLARPPEGPDQYEITIPHPPEGSPNWNPDAWAHFRATAHEAGLSHHQAQSLTNFFATQGAAMVRQAGPDGLSPEQLGQCVTRAKGIGLTAQQTSAMLDLLESQVSPRTGKPQAQVAAELMADAASGYFDRAHPKHQATVARVKKLFAEADEGPGYNRR